MGKTHLLQATYQDLLHRGMQGFYFDLAQRSQISPECFSDLGKAYDLICLDGLEHIAGNTIWEQALFDLHHQLKDQQKYWLIAANDTPGLLNIALADLISRLQQGVIFHVKPLSHDVLYHAIELKLSNYGFDVGHDVLRYITERAERDMSALSCAMVQLHKLSLREKKPLTKPFIRKTLGW